MLLERASQPVATKPSSRVALIDLAAKGARDIVNGLHQWRLWYLIGSSDCADATRALGWGSSGS